MKSEYEIRERLEDTRHWQEKEDKGSDLDGMLRSKIDELKWVLES